MFSDRTNWKLGQNRFTAGYRRGTSERSEVLDLDGFESYASGYWSFDSAAILEALASSQALDYDPQSKGLLEARQAVAAYYRDEHACAIWMRSESC